MQKGSVNKKKNELKPVYKPYLRGLAFSKLAMKRGLKVFGMLMAFAFFGMIASSVLGFDNVFFRVLMNGVLLLFGCFLMLNEGSRLGENDVSFAEIALNRQSEGKEVSPSDKAVCYHPAKGFVTALTGVAPFLLITIVYALIAKKQTYTLGALPSWVSSYTMQDEVGQALAYYTETNGFGLVDALRLIVRLVLFPYMNMIGMGNYDRLYLLDKLSPLLMIIVPAFYAVGYLRGPRLRALVHGSVRMARRRHNRNERKAREQRVRKSQQKKELI